MITSKLRVFALQRKSERKLGEKIARKKKPRQCYLEYVSYKFEKHDLHFKL